MKGTCEHFSLRFLLNLILAHLMSIYLDILKGLGSSASLLLRCTDAGIFSVILLFPTESYSIQNGKGMKNDVSDFDRHVHYLPRSVLLHEI